MSESVIRLEKVFFSYGGPLVLEDVDLDVESGEFLGVVGPNGSGKSTLLKLVLGLLEPTSGRVRVRELEPRRARRVIGYVPQTASFSLDFPISVEETVLLGRLGRTHVLGGYRRRDHAVAEQAMREADVLDLRRRALGTLSGGQLQRVLIARALASEPEILLLDEPVASVDVRAQGDIFALLRKLNQRCTIIVVSHDIGFITEHVTRVACVNRTLLCHATARINSEVIESLYGAPVSLIRHRHTEMQFPREGP